MIYDAFISYRHANLDTEIAKKVHTGLETYHVPKAVQKKTGKKKIERVFRDQEELPIGSDLNENIAGALKESEYLIVICSPETPGSYWVNKEIETFIGLHGRQKVLAVLVDGEPGESFPAMLLSDENGKPVEPLAADVRGATASERNKKFKSELLRLLAPVLGCSYDDLRQRHRERILKRNLTFAGIGAGIIAAAGAAFGIYNANIADRMKKLADEKAVLADEKSVLADEKTQLADEMKNLADEKTRLADEILNEYREKQVNQSRFYAEEAMAQLQAGNREDAVLIASAGLPTADNDRPYVPEAEYALASALHAYDCGMELDYDRILQHDRIVYDMVTDQSAKYLTSVDDDYDVYVWDTETCKLLTRLTYERRHRKVIFAKAFSDGLYIISDQGIERYDFTGEQRAGINIDERILRGAVYEKNDMAVIACADAVRIIPLSVFSIAKKIPMPKEGAVVSCFKLSGDGQWLAFGYSTEEEAGVVCVNMNDFTVKTVSVTGGYVLDLTVTDAGNIAAVSTNSDFFYTTLKELTLDVFAADSAEKLYSKSIPCEGWNSDFSLKISSHSYGENRDIVIAAEAHAYSFDEKSGDLRAHVTLPDQAATLDLFNNTPTGYIGCRNGEIVAVNTAEGTIITENTVVTNSTMKDMLIINGGIVLQIPRSDGLKVMKYHKASDLTELPALAEHSYGVAASPSSDYYVLTSRFKSNEYTFYDGKGELLFTVNRKLATMAYGFSGDTFILVDRNGYCLIDPAKQQCRDVSFESLGITIAAKGGNFSADGGRLAIMGSLGGVAVIDLNNEQCVFAEERMDKIDAVSLSADGSVLFIARKNYTLYVSEVNKNTLEQLNDIALMPYDDSYFLKYLVCDSAGKYAAMACPDGFLRVISIASKDTVLKIPMQAHSVCFIGFTKDAEHIILQSDDYRVRIYGIQDGVCESIFEVTEKIAYMTEDEDFIALCDNYTVSLVDAKTFGRVAFVNHAATYLSKEKKFVLLSGRKVWSSAYKDYGSLLDEAKRQFPGSCLSEEKKVMYNIE